MAINIEDLQAAQDIAANGNIESIVNEKSHDLAPDVDTSGTMEWDNAFGDQLEVEGDASAWEYFLWYNFSNKEYTVEDSYEDFLGLGNKEKQKARKVKRKEKKAAKQEAKAEKKAGTKRGEKLAKKADVNRAKAEAYRTSATKDEAKVKIAEAKSELGTKGQKFLSKLGMGVKKIGLGPQRAAMLILLRMNLFGLSKKLKEKMAKNPTLKTNLENKWLRWGGSRKKMNEQIDKGAKKKSLIVKWRKKKGADGSNEDEFIIDEKTWYENADAEWANVAGETAALIASATPLIVGILSLIGEKPEDMDDETLENIKSEAADQEGLTEKAQKEQDEINKVTPESERDKFAGVNTKKYLLISGGLLAAGLLVWIFTRKKK